MSIKLTRARAAYSGFRGNQTMAVVESHLTDDLKQRLTGAELGAVMSIIAHAYNAGRASTGASVENDAVWIDALGRLMPIDALRAIKIDTTTGDRLISAHAVQSRLHSGILYDAAGNRLDEVQTNIARMHNGKGAYFREHTRSTRYELDYTEAC